jgi:hypothetical protein
MTLKAFQNLIARYPELELENESGWYNVYHTSKIMDKTLCWYSTGKEMAHLITSFTLIYSSYYKRFELAPYKTVDVCDINKAKKFLEHSLNDLNKLILLKKEFNNNLNELSIKEDFE